MKIRSVIHTRSRIARVEPALAAIALTLLIGFASAPVPAQERSAQNTVQSAPAQPKFNIFEFQIEGNSRLPEPAIERAVTPFLGEEKTVAEVELARAALERAYHDAGYLTVVVSIPEQNVDSGVVSLQVVEAPVERLRVKGSEYHTLSGIKSRVPELAEGNVPHFPKMQRELANVNRNADLRATPILRAGRAPGTVEVQLDVEDQLPLHGSIELSNRQSPNTTATRLSGSMRYDNLWQLRHSIGLSMQLSPEKADEVRVLSGTYVMPVGSDGNALTFYSVHSRSKLATLANAPGLGVLGNSDFFGMRYGVPLDSTEKFSHAFSTGADYKNVRQSIIVNGAGGTSDPITYVPLVAIYNANWLGKNPTTLDLTATMGVRGIFGNTESEFANKRHEASANYLALRADLHRKQSIDKWTLFGKLDMQWASGPLVSNEQFTAGGADSVRGYLEGERAGDVAVRTSLELQTRQFKPAGATSLWGITALVFADAALLRTFKAVYPQPRYEQMRSYGIGARFTAPRSVAVDVDWAHAIDNADVTRAGTNRVHARMVWGY